MTPGTNATATTQVSAPAPAPSPPAPRRRLRAWIVGLLGGSLVALLATFYLLMHFAAGDFVSDPFHGRGLEVSVSPLPRWRHISFDTATAAPASPPSYRFWWRSWKELVLATYTPGAAANSSAMPTGGAAAPTMPAYHTGLLVPVDGSATAFTHRELTMQLSFSSSGPRTTSIVPRTSGVERIPAGSVRALGDRMAAADWTGALDVARRVRADAPEAIFPRYWLISLLVRTGAFAEAERELAAWAARLEGKNDPREVPLYLVAEIEFSQPHGGPAIDGRELGRFLPAHRSAVLAATSFSMDEFLEWSAKQEGRRGPPRYSFPHDRFGYGALRLDEEAVVHATLMLLRGEHERATAVLFGLFAVAQSHLFTRWRAGSEPSTIGFRDARVISSLQNVLIRSTMTAEDLEGYWQRLEQALSVRVGPRAAILGRLGPSKSQRNSMVFSTSDRDPLQEARDREFEIQALREAVRIRHHFLATGRWPERDEAGHAVGLLLETQDPPLDPFVYPSQRLKFRIVDVTRGQSGNAEVYGAPSASTLKIPASPPFDYPREPGYVYAGMQEFKDRYRQTIHSEIKVRWIPPILVMHRGSDLVEDHKHRDLLPGLPVEVQYDPTNGIWSNGDIWTWLPVEGHAVKSFEEYAAAAEAREAKRAAAAARAAEGEEESAPANEGNQPDALPPLLDGPDAPSPNPFGPDPFAPPPATLSEP